MKKRLITIALMALLPGLYLNTLVAYDPAQLQAFCDGYCGDRYSSVTVDFNECVSNCVYGTPGTWGYESNPAWVVFFPGVYVGGSGGHHGHRGGSGFVRTHSRGTSSSTGGASRSSSRSTVNRSSSKKRK